MLRRDGSPLRAKLVAALVVLVVLPACGGGGENVESCRRYIELIEGTEEGRVSPNEFYERVQQLGPFEEGSELRRFHRGLVSSLRNEDLDRAQSAQTALQDECMNELEQ